ncbi:PapD pilus/flagellar-assembly chaperone N-terminal domain protein [Providencia alcalifaciens R90-1475]|nr:PapD pilus/flagellar-assembly chaperone N-terminal domain protein [Providencia alcalifaciens R90-1475]
MAAFIINGTRFIYEEGKNNISFEVTNSSDKTYGGQVWIDNTDQGNNVYMIPQPPFFKIGEKQKQVIRIINTDSSLSKDKELLFWLNVQEVPPQPDAKDNVGNLLAIAMNTRVKLIYRPLSIKDDRRDAENKLLLVQDGNKTLLKNPTPYYFSIIGIKNNSKDVRLSSNVQENISRLAPFSSVSLDTKINRKVSIEAVNDWGGVQAYDIH